MAFFDFLRGHRSSRDEWENPRGEGFQRRGWREGSDYYGDDPERYGAGNYDAGAFGAGRYAGREYAGESRSYGRDWQGADAGGSESHFRGRGPKGYRRSDERIREDMCDCLTEDDCIDASNIDVAVKDCEVTLSGTVSSREEKRRAEDLIEEISGVRDVRNSLRVAERESTLQQHSAPAQTDQTSPIARH